MGECVISSLPRCDTIPTQLISSYANCATRDGRSAQTPMTRTTLATDVLQPAFCSSAFPDPFPRKPYSGFFLSLDTKRKNEHQLMFVLFMTPQSYIWLAKVGYCRTVSKFASLPFMGPRHHLNVGLPTSRRLASPFKSISSNFETVRVCTPFPR